MSDEQLDNAPNRAAIESLIRWGEQEGRLYVAAVVKIAGEFTGNNVLATRELLVDAVMLLVEARRQLRAGESAVVA